MADNASYDASLWPASPQLEAMKDEAVRQQVLSNIGPSPMIAPAPVAMSPMEIEAAAQRQNLANAGGTADIASMYDESAAAQKAFPNQQNMSDTLAMQTGDMPLEQAQLEAPAEDLNAKYGLQAETKVQNPKAVLDMFGPLNQQLKAQDQLRNAAGALEGSRQESLKAQEANQVKRVTEFESLKKNYDSELNNRMKAIDAELAQVDSDAKQARKSTSDLFAEKGTGQKVAAGIAIILGVAHAGLGGGNGGNMGVKVIEDALQKEKDNNLNKFAQSKQMLELRRKNFDDYTQAMQQHEQLNDRQQLLQMQVIKTKFEQAESVYRNSAAGAAATQAKALINDQILQRKASIANSEAVKNLMQSGQLSTLTPAEISMLPIDPEMKKGLLANRELSVPGYQGIALSKEDRDQFQKYKQSAEPAISGLQRILDLQKNTSRLSLVDRARISSEVNAATGALREAIVGPGAMTQQEYERLIATLGNPNKLFSLPSWERAKTMTALNKLKSDLSSIAKSRGLVPPQEFRGSFKETDVKNAESTLQKYLKPAK